MSRISVAVTCHEGGVCKQMQGEITFGTVITKSAPCEMKAETFLIGGGVKKEDLMHGIGKSICELIDKLEENPVEQLMYLEDIAEIIERRQQEIAAKSTGELFTQFMKIFK